MTSFGALVTLDELSGGDVLKWESILDLPYMVVLRKRQLNNAINEYRRRYNDVLKRKNK